MDDGPLVSYGESTGPPLRWGLGLARASSSSVQGSEQQCDDTRYLSSRWTQTDGLYSNVEGEALGDFC